jgi:hypothetical protein
VEVPGGGLCEIDRVITAPRRGAVTNRGPVSAPDAGERGPAPVNLAAQRWLDRLPDRPTLEHLGFGFEQAGSTAYPRMTHLIGHLCNSQGWDPNEFVGHRCQVDFPVWGVQYIMSFDFGGGESERELDP